MNSREQARVCHSSELNKDSSWDQNWVLPSRYFHGSRQVRGANIFIRTDMLGSGLHVIKSSVSNSWKRGASSITCPPIKKSQSYQELSRLSGLKKADRVIFSCFQIFKNIHANAIFRLPSCSQFYANMDPDWSNHLRTGSILSWQHQRTKSDSNVLVGSIWREGGSVQSPI